MKPDIEIVEEFLRKQIRSHSTDGVIKRLNRAEAETYKEFEIYKQGYVAALDDVLAFILTFEMEKIREKDDKKN
jgi:hypothetical protein